MYSYAHVRTLVCTRHTVIYTHARRGDIGTTIVMIGDDQTDRARQQPRARSQGRIQAYIYGVLKIHIHIISIMCSYAWHTYVRWYARGAPPFSVTHAATFGAHSVSIESRSHDRINTCSHDFSRSRDSSPMNEAYTSYRRCTHAHAHYAACKDAAHRTHARGAADIYGRENDATPEKRYIPKRPILRRTEKLPGKRLHFFIAPYNKNPYKNES